MDAYSNIEQIYKKMVGFQGLEDVRLSIFPILKENWGGQFPFEYFVSLERLVVDDSAIISNGISSHLLGYLKKLKVLIVEKCDLVGQVFDLEGVNSVECGINQMEKLNELHLIDLPKLTHVWSKDPQQIMSFENLQLLKVHNCANLNYVFDISMALSLPNLQHVEVKNCSLMEHIIVKEEREKMQDYQTIFPSLQSMNLHHLTNLLSFYSTNGFLECPPLETIEVVECPKMTLFASTFSNGQDSCMIAEEKEELISNEIMFLGNKMAIPGLEELKVEWNSLEGLLFGKNQPGFLHSLKCIELTGFQGEEYAILPSNFLQHFPKLEKLALSDALVEEINLQELSFLKGKDAESVALLTKLKLSNLPKLKHLVHDDSQLVPLFQNLEDLEVVECSRLKILVPSTVSFQNLINLEVSKCDGLINLMTASTARSLVQLKRMNVKDCKMMQEIVAISSDGVEYEIRFSQLEYVGLDDLPCLTSFCSGNYAFHFPSLKEVMVTGCLNMKFFTEQVPTAPMLRKVKTGTRVYDWEWEGSLNNTIQALFLGKDSDETDT
ncbi:probable disease resistance protein At1g62630 isoform X2 [Euphorbia lathyris]|uniref:probable disease resistance protein At1g62630 isoform X2 n=1 Tax=Euphorbia lathyris TaxID=212925 RepID=UPI003313241C